MPPKPTDLLQDLKRKLPRPLERQPDPTGRRSVSASRPIEAPAGRIFAVLVDPRRLTEVDGSGSIVSLLSPLPTRLGPGVRFSANLRRRLPYRATFTVVEFDEGRRIAWAHPGGHRWRFRLEPAADGRTLVTETLDWSTSLAPFLFERLGLPAGAPAEMQATLARLDAVVLGAGSPTPGS